MGKLVADVEAELSTHDQQPQTRILAQSLVFWLLILGLFSFVSLWLLLPSLQCFVSAAYGIAYWAANSVPPGQWAVPTAYHRELNYSVPTIIHQTWRDRTIPDKWAAAQKSCKDLHPDFEWKLWTDADSLQFIKVRCTSRKKQRALPA